MADRYDAIEDRDTITKALDGMQQNGPQRWYDALKRLDRLYAENAAMRSMLAELVMEAPDDRAAIGALQEQARTLLAQAHSGESEAE